MPQGKKGEADDTSSSVLNPLDAMVITRERLQDTLDDAVRRGRMTRDDATDLLAEIVRRALSPPADRVQYETRRAELGSDKFGRIRDYERRNANRKTVLSALDAKLI